MFVVGNNFKNDPYKNFPEFVFIDRFVQSIPYFDKETGYIFYDIKKEKIAKKEFNRKGYKLVNISQHAAKTGNLDLFKKAEKKGLTRYENDLCEIAIKNNNYDFLVYLVENGYKMNTLTFSCSVLSDNLILMDYLYKNKCPWDEESTQVAMEFNKPEALKFLLERKCPIDLSYIENPSAEIVKILKDYKINI